MIVTAEITAVTFLKGYVRHLGQNGWDVRIIGRSTGRLEPWAQSEGAVGLSVGFEREPAPLADVKALAQTLRLLLKDRPDVVVTATPKAGLLGTVAAWIARVPVRVYQVWGLRLETETGLKRRVLAALERVAVMASTQVVANSASLAEELASEGLVGRRPVRVLGAGSSHGVDVMHFAPSSGGPLDDGTRRFLALQPDDLAIVFIGRLAIDKGIDTLVQALGMCRDRGRRVRALIVGPVENVDVGSLVPDAVSDLVHLVGSATDVRPYIAAADVLCLPTLREGFPNVVLEAASMGVPAIVSDATGAVDSVVAGVTGQVFPVGDAAALADAIERYIDDPEQVRRHGEAARERAVNDFEQSRIWDLQLDNIEQQWARSRGAGRSR
ncbi:glycosyltransferase family 4 protein [Propionibacteriaceae bacterium G1746]